MRGLTARIVAALPLGEMTVVIGEGRATVRRGRVRPTLVDELAEVALAEGIGHAVIHARPREGGGFHLRLYGIPNRLHQRFRNVWAAGWR